MLTKSLLALKKSKFFIGAVFWTVLIAYLSFASPNSLPDVQVSNSDKIAHFSVYFVLTILWTLFFFYEKNLKKTKAILLSGVLAFFYGTFVEVMQSVLTTFRTSDYLDAIANTFGIVIASILCSILLKRVKS